MMMLKKMPRLKRNFANRGTVSFMQEIFILYFGLKDRRTPVFSKLVSFAALFYLLSPVDFIPDFIPVAGYLDDIIIVPFLLHVAFRLMPATVKETSFIKAKKNIIWLRIGLLILLMLLVLIMAAIFFFIKNLFHY